MEQIKEHQLTALSFVVDGRGDLTKKFFNPVKLGSMASARMQLMPAIKSASKQGYKIQILSLHSDSYSQFNLVSKSKVCLIGKLSANSDDLLQSMAVANLAAVTRLKNRGAKIVLQYSDNAFHEDGILKDFYLDLMHAADYIVYPSDALKKITAKFVKAGTKQLVICDPWQLKSFHEPRKILEETTVKIIWFGSSKNIDYLFQAFKEILEYKNLPSSKKYELTIMGNEWSISRFKDKLKSIKIANQEWIIRAVLWKNDFQPNQLETEISRAHIALIPSDPHDPLKAGVSHNRVVDAIRGGCITIASPMESYKELSSIAILGDNMGQLLSCAIKNYNYYADKLKTKSELAVIKFSPENNRTKWNNFWKNLENENQLSSSNLT